MDNFINTSVHYTRIDKRQARKIYNGGGSVVILPHRANPHSIWFDGADFSKENTGNKDFDGLVSEFTYYNCNTAELGRYPAFYVLTTNE